MISAIDMFRWLGFIQIDNSKEKVVYKLKLGDCYIEFYKNTYNFKAYISKVIVGEVVNVPALISDNLLKAIIQQEKELGWIE